MENDACSDATTVPAIPYANSGTTVAATPESRDTQRCSWVSETARGVFYEVVGTGFCVAAELESDYYDSIAIYEGNCGELSCVVQSVANLNTPKHVAWQSKNGTLYKVYVAGFEDIVGKYNLTISDCLERDECIKPAKIDELPFYVSDTTENSTATFWHSSACTEFYTAYSFGYGYWYELSGTGSCIKASTAGSEINTVMGVYTGEDCEDLTCVSFNDDDELNSNSSLVSWQSTEGTQYRIHVAGYALEKGPFNLNITETPCAVQSA